MYKELKGIRPPTDNDVLWRFMSFEKFVNILAKKSLFFTRADKFEDRFEGHIPTLIEQYYKQKTDRFGETGGRAVRELWEKWRKCVMCSCWHRGNQESMGMWGRYDMHNSGIAIKTTMQHLKSSFTHNGNVDVHIGKVKYVEHQDLRIPRNIHVMHTIYLPFFYKRTAFKFENEVRAIIDASPYIKEEFFRVKEGFSLSRRNFDLPTLLERLEDTEINVGKPGQSLDICPKTLIGEVIISPYAESWVTETAESIVHKYGFKFPVNPSKLLDPPD